MHNAMLRHSSASRFFWQKRQSVEVKAFFIVPCSFLLQEAYVRSQLLFGDEEEDSESTSRIKTGEIPGIMKI